MNKSLLSFKEAWNNHPLSSERNRSPLQLYAGGSLGNPLFEGEIDLASYGVDFEASPDEESEGEGSVFVPATDIGLSDADLQDLLTHLQAQVDPLQPCDDNGIQFYKNTVATLFHFLSS